MKFTAISSLVAITLLSSSAHSQQQDTPPAPFTAPDRELWDLMVKLLGDVPIALPAHQQVQGILQGIQREAYLREDRRKRHSPAPQVPLPTPAPGPQQEEQK